MTKVIGITGLLSSGKSTMTNYIRDKGFKVFDADSEVKKLYGDKDFLQKLQNKFPDAFENNNLNKNKLTEIIFSNVKNREKLEALIHPIVEKKCDEFIKKYADKKVIFLDIPLLFEVGWDKKCDEIILVMVDRKIQKQRYLDRGGEPKLFDRIIANQSDIEEKTKKSTHIIENNSTLGDFYGKIDAILKNLW